MLSEAFFRSQKIQPVIFFLLYASKMLLIKEYEASVVEGWGLKPNCSLTRMLLS
jgi:hypothetical protein